MPKKAATKRATKSTAKKPRNNSAASPETSTATQDAAPVSENGANHSTDYSESSDTVDSDVAAAEARDHAVLDVLQAHDVVITRQQYLLLTDPQMRAVNAWVDAINAADGKSVPGMPVCLMPFLTAEARAKLHPPKEPHLPPRKFSGCEFGNVSIGDQTASIPVKVDADRFEPEEAHEILCGRRVEATIALEENAERAQKRIESFEPPKIHTVCDIKSYRGTVNDWGFKLTFALQEIDVGTLGQFAHRSGRIELQVLGNAESEEDSDDPPRPRGRPKKTDPPHPDVEEGKNKPHGLPFLEEAAKAQAEKDAGEAERAKADEDFAAGIEPSPGGPIEISLRMAAITLPADVDRHAWPENVRREVDAFAKIVAAHAAGDTSDFLPEIPDVLRPHLSAEQIDNPVKFAKAHTKSPLWWLCTQCNEEWALTRGRRCPQCDASGSQDVMLLGFYGENVSIGGYWFGPELLEYQVLPQTPWQTCVVRVAKARDGRYRGSILAELLPTSGEADQINALPSIFDGSHVTQGQAIAAAIGKLIDRWQPITDDRAELATAALKEYLGRIEGGADPLELEQALPAATEE
jgi:hypothetical protein